MDSELMATEVKCRNGVTFRVHAAGPTTIVVSAPADETTRTSGLSTYMIEAPIPNGSGFGRHVGMPVETVRAYAKAHGGVAQAGATALALLKQLPSEAAPSPSAPAPDSRHPAAVEAARPPLSGAGAWAAIMAARPATAAAVRAAQLAPGFDIDELTPAVIEARKALAEFDAGFLFRGRTPAHPGEELDAWYSRATAGAGLGARLIIATHDRYARHPLVEEARALRGRLLAYADEARAEIPAAQLRANGLRVPHLQDSA